MARRDGAVVEQRVVVISDAVGVRFCAGWFKFVCLRVVFCLARMTVVIFARI